ncbi:MAG: hypothetical protein SGILL_002476 [Bacillariaceae sp.]
MLLIILIRYILKSKTNIDPTMRNRTSTTRGSSTVSDCFESRGRRQQDPPSDHVAAYASDSEDSCRSAPVSPSLTRRLLGPNPSPKGRKMRFALDEDDREEQEDNKNHSPVAKRFVLRRLSLSPSGNRSHAKRIVCLGCLLSGVALLCYAFSTGSDASYNAQHEYRSLRTQKRGGAWKPKQDIEQWPTPQVVVLPGPHMTATTSIQMCMSKWTMKEEGLLDNWLWPVPETPAFLERNLVSQGAAKNFAPLFGILSGQKHFRFQMSHFSTSEYAVEAYKKPLLKAWENGKRLVYGSEEMDLATSDLESIDPDKIMDGVFDILPWGEESRKLEMEDIEVVVLHKGSRIDHLLEIWQEVAVKGRSFRNFLSERSDILSTIDGLGLAKMYLERGVRVSIVDTSGIDGRKGGNICHTISCDVLGVPCTKSNVVETISIEDDVSRGSHSMLAARPGDLELTTEQMRRIDEILNEYDCGLRASMQQHEKLLRILNQEDLFSNCPATQLPDRPFSWVVNQILAIVRPTGDADTPGTPREASIETVSSPEVVILPGPHGASSAHLQNCFSSWGNKENAIIGDWSWPAPNATDINSLNVINLGTSKAFAPLYAMLSGQKSFSLDQEQEFDLKKAKDVYRAPMLEAWKNGKKLVYGSAEMDWGISILDTTDTTAVMDGVFDILPWKGDESRVLDKRNITAVIPYDVNRVDHLRGIWRSVARGTNATFRDFLSTKGRLYSTTNAMGLARSYLDRGINTVVVNMAGVSALGSDVDQCHVVACEVMGIHCDQQTHKLASVSKPELLDVPIEGIREDPADLDLTDEEIATIEAIMKEYDCGVKGVISEHKNTGLLEVLYSQEFLADCPEFSPRKRFSWMIREIQKVARKDNNKSLRL